MEHVTERAPLDALPLLSRALGYEESLRSRTEGLTWAIWGVVLALIFFMYGSLGALGHDMPAWIGLLWIVWVLAGSALTWALWRTAALRIGGATRRPAGLVVTLAWIGAILGAFALVMLGPPLPNAENAALLAVGLAWTLMGGANLFRATRAGRAATLTIGLVTLAIGLAMSLFLPSPDWSSASGDAQRFAQDLLRGAVAAFVPLAVGLWQALRG